MRVAQGVWLVTTHKTGKVTAVAVLVVTLVLEARVVIIPKTRAKMVLAVRAVAVFLAHLAGS